mgnify:CR=1 FL=1
MRILYKNIVKKYKFQSKFYPKQCLIRIFGPNLYVSGRMPNPNEGGCFSHLGMVGGAQTLSLGPFCVNNGIVQHEFLHSLGLHHEQVRPDRDDYIQVIF